MLLSELLSELRETLGDVSDETGNGDYLWSDAKLVRYINEAQRRFASRALVIRDGTTPECCEITLVAGQSSYALHPAVIAVVSAKTEDSDVDLARTGHNALARWRQDDDWWLDPAQFSVLPAGSPLAYATDEGLGGDDDETWSAMSLRVYPEPDAAAAGTVIQLRVIRKPLDELSTSNLSATPEIPADHHINMLDWAAYLALRVNDQDAGNLTRAKLFADSFEMHVKEARAMVMRKLFAPQPIAFGRNGWAWGS